MVPPALAAISLIRRCAPSKTQASLVLPIAFAGLPQEMGSLEPGAGGVKAAIGHTTRRARRKQ